MACFLLGGETCACEACQRMARLERAERQVAAVREALARYDETPQRQVGGSPSYRALVRLEGAIRAALETE